MESVILGVILALVTFYSLLAPFGVVWAIILAVVVFVLSAGVVGYVLRRNPR